MKEIKMLTEMIEEEIEGAEQYAKDALMMREEHPEIAKTFFDISIDEVKHIDMLHGCAKRLIENHRREHGEPPAPMMAVYEYLHKKHIEKLAMIKTYQAQYKEHM